MEDGLHPQSNRYPVETLPTRAQGGVYLGIAVSTLRREPGELLRGDILAGHVLSISPFVR